MIVLQPTRGWGLKNHVFIAKKRAHPGFSSFKVKKPVATARKVAEAHGRDRLYRSSQLGGSVGSHTSMCARQFSGIWARSTSMRMKRTPTTKLATSSMASQRWSASAPSAAARSVMLSMMTTRSGSVLSGVHSSCPRSRSAVVRRSRSAVMRATIGARSAVWRATVSWWLQAKK